MEAFEQLSTTLALTLGVGWASGINLYAALVTLGLMSYGGGFDLPPDLAIIAHPLVIGAAGVMYGIEFFADKIPGVDSVWDSLHTFIRIPAGAMLAAGTVGDISPAMEITAAIVGGSLATGSHATKAGSRVLINTSPEPFSNWAASIGEDISVIGGMWLAVHNPVWFLIALAVFIGLVIFLLPKIWRGIKKVFQFFIRLFGGNPETEPPPS